MSIPQGGSSWLGLPCYADLVDRHGSCQIHETLVGIFSVEEITAVLSRLV